MHRKQYKYIYINILCIKHSNQFSIITDHPSIVLTFSFLILFVNALIIAIQLLPWILFVDYTQYQLIFQHN